MATKLYLVIPCYNEEAVLPETTRRLHDKMRALMEAGTISFDSHVCLVDDGSKDQTWQMIEAFHRENPLFSGVKLSRNRGHQNALLAGLMTVKDRCDCVISMDADLQDDIDAIDRFLAAYEEGCDIVYGVRSSRETDTGFKRSTAQGYYKFMAMLGVEIVYNHADYRLMSRRALDALAEYKEVNLFLRGIVPLIGFKTATVEYARGERFAGESKYPLKKMLAFAFEGITSFSVRPIRLVLAAGVLMAVLAAIFFLWSLLGMLFGFFAPAWPAVVPSVFLTCGLELAAIGVVGEYVGRIYMEVKGRPRFLIDQFLDGDEA